jgi:hypothetical protein
MMMISTTSIASDRPAHLAELGSAKVSHGPNCDVYYLVTYPPGRPSRQAERDHPLK